MKSADQLVVRWCYTYVCRLSTSTEAAYRQPLRGHSSIQHGRDVHSLPFPPHSPHDLPVRSRYAARLIKVEADPARSPPYPRAHPRHHSHCPRASSAPLSLSTDRASELYDPSSRTHCSKYSHARTHVDSSRRRSAADRSQYIRPRPRQQRRTRLPGKRNRQAGPCPEC